MTRFEDEVKFELQYNFNRSKVWHTVEVFTDEAKAVEQRDTPFHDIRKRVLRSVTTREVL